MDRAILPGQVWLMTREYAAKHPGDESVGDLLVVLSWDMVRWQGEEPSVVCELAQFPVNREKTIGGARKRYFNEEDFEELKMVGSITDLLYEVEAPGSLGL